MRRNPERELRIKQEEGIRSLAEKNPDQLEDEITRIRASMDQTLTDIERKFGSGEIVRRIGDYFAAGPGEFGSNLAGVLKKNPIPVLMVGIGLAWLGLAGAREKSREAEKTYLEAYEKYARKRRRRESWKDLSHSVSRFRGKVRRTHKEVVAAAEPERRHSKRRHRSTRRKEVSGRIRAPLMSSLGAVVGAALSTALPKRH